MEHRRGPNPLAGEPLPDAGFLPDPVLEWNIER